MNNCNYCNYGVCYKVHTKGSILFSYGHLKLSLTLENSVYYRYPSYEMAA